MKENSIEEDIEIIESIIEEYENCCVPEIDMQVDVTFREKQNNALNHILSDYKRVLKENEELKEINEQLSENKLLQDIEIKKKFIPVQKIKDKIEEIQEEGYWLFTTDRDSDKCVEVLQELLEK